MINDIDRLLRKNGKRVSPILCKYYIHESIICEGDRLYAMGMAQKAPTVFDPLQIKVEEQLEAVWNDVDALNAVDTNKPAAKEMSTFRVISCDPKWSRVPSNRSGR